MLGKVISTFIVIAIGASIAYQMGWLSRKGEKVYDNAKDRVVEKSEKVIDKTKDAIK